jgi:hypothetical protein
MAIYPELTHETVRRLHVSRRDGDKAEARVYSLLHDRFHFSAEWAVLWSVPVPGGAQGREIDFIVAHQNLGMALIEVKSPALVPRERGWVHVRSDSEPSYGKEAPDRQLEQATSHLKQWLQRIRPDLRYLPRMVQIVVLPNTVHADLMKPATRNTLAIGTRLVLADKCVELFQRRKTYICVAEDLEILPDVVRHILEEAQGGHGKCHVEETLFREVIPQLAHQAGARAIIVGVPIKRIIAAVAAAAVAAVLGLWVFRGAALVVPPQAVTEPSKIAAPLPPTPLPPAPAETGPPATERKAEPAGPPHTKHGKKDRRHQAAPAPALQSRPASMSSSMPAQPEPMAVFDANGRECTERRFPGSIGGETVQLVEKMCRINGQMVRVTD